MLYLVEFRGFLCGCVLAPAYPLHHSAFPNGPVENGAS
jgi:hypothetical protein